jgi:hypothetical protein
MRWMDDIKSVTGFSVNDLNQLVKDRKKWKLLVNNTVKKRKRTYIYSKGKATANIRKDHQESYRLDGLHYHRMYYVKSFALQLLLHIKD